MSTLGKRQREVRKLCRRSAKAWKRRQRKAARRLARTVAEIHGGLMAGFDRLWYG